jgi:hypothetical protein
LHDSNAADAQEQVSRAYNIRIPTSRLEQRIQWTCIDVPEPRSYECMYQYHYIPSCACHQHVHYGRYTAALWSRKSMAYPQGGQTRKALPIPRFCHVPICWCGDKQAVRHTSTIVWGHALVRCHGDAPQLLARILPAIVPHIFIMS